MNAYQPISADRIAAARRFWTKTAVAQADFHIIFYNIQYLHYIRHIISCRAARTCACGYDQVQTYQMPMIIFF
jgi:hypothetical protein